MNRGFAHELLTAKIAKETQRTRRRAVVRRIANFLFCGLSMLVALTGCLRAQTTIRVGAFPNITHAQPMIGKANGDFEKAMGPSVKIQWTSFNAGPSAIEALFAGAIDMTYIGPNPAITGYVRSGGEALRVVAGAASGGGATGGRHGSGIQEPEEFSGNKGGSA